MSSVMFLVYICIYVYIARNSQTPQYLGEFRVPVLKFRFCAAIIWPVQVLDMSRFDN